MSCTTAVTDVVRASPRVEPIVEVSLKDHDWGVSFYSCPNPDFIGIRLTGASTWWGAERKGDKTATSTIHSSKEEVRTLANALLEMTGEA